MQRRRKRQVSPKGFKKHSSIVQQRSVNDIVVQGERVETSTGYIIPGFNGKAFETFWEVILDGNASPLVRHPAKERVIRVISGSGYAILHKEDEEGNPEIEEIKLNAGDEIVLEPGVAYRIAASTPLEFFGIQTEKYVSRLHTIEPPVVGTEVTPDAFLWNKRAEQQPPIQRRANMSKAAAQQRADSVNKGRPVPPAIPVGGNHGAAAGLNPQPGGGRQFDEAGAG